MKDFLNKQITITRDEFLSKAAKVTKFIVEKTGEPMSILLIGLVSAELATELFDKEEPKKEGESTTPEQTTTKKKRYFKIKDISAVEKDFNIHVGDVGVLVGERNEMQYILFNEKWDGHSANLPNYKDNPHCWIFNKARVEEVTEEEKAA